MRHRGRAPDREEHDDGASASSPDDIFVSFVRRANAEWIASVEAVLSEPLALERGVAHTEADEHAEATADERVEVEADENDVEADDDDDPEPEADGTDRVVLLTQKKSHPPPKPRDEVTVRKSAEEILASRKRSRRPRPRPAPTTSTAPEEWQSVVPRPSEDTQRREAQRVVPDVASVPPPVDLPQEGSEDGQMPSAELDRKLADMDVLLRYGHHAQVEAELVALRSAYPGDLLLVRRVAELYITRSLAPPALEALFALATGLFERRNVEGMRQTLEQVLVLDPDNGRAQRLLSLLEQRPSSPPKSHR